MSHFFEKVVLLLLFPAFCPAQSLTPLQALDGYLARARDRQPGCSDMLFAVQIDASLPKLGKEGSMSGLKLVSRTGQSVYSGLRFTGDNLFKTAVIARFLANDAEPPEAAAGAGVTHQNYSFVYEKTSDYNGLVAYLFRLKPKRKRVGLFKGELWLDANTAEPLRMSGDLIKSPSIFIQRFRFVQDYQLVSHYFQPVRLLLTIQTRIAGLAQITVSLHSVEAQPVATPTTACASNSAGIPDNGQ
jgi:hypothetical protein